MAGFNLPPGCSVRDIPGNGPDEPCGVCGQFEDACLCPECPECGNHGDPRCYGPHGLTRTQTQVDSLAAAEKKWEEDAASEAEFYANNPEYQEEGNQ